MEKIKKAHPKFKTIFLEEERSERRETEKVEILVRAISSSRPYSFVWRWLDGEYKFPRQERIERIYHNYIRAFIKE